MEPESMAEQDIINAGVVENSSIIPIMQIKEKEKKAVL